MSFFDVARIDKFAAGVVEIDVFVATGIAVFRRISDGRTAVVADIAVISLKRRITIVAERLSVEILPAA